MGLTPDEAHVAAGIEECLRRGQRLQELHGCTCMRLLVGLGCKDAGPSGSPDQAHAVASLELGLWRGVREVCSHGGM